MKASDVVPCPIVNCKLHRIPDILACCVAVQSDFFDFSQNIIEATETLKLEIVFLFLVLTAIAGGEKRRWLAAVT